MVKFFLSRHTFELPWESVTNAWWQKYPNQHSLQITEVDIIDRRLDPSTGELITRRLISAGINPPRWMTAVGFPDSCYVLEETSVNPHGRHLVLKSVNVTGSDLLQVQETCLYKSVDNNEKCLYEQSATITSFIPLVTDAIEQYSLGIQTDSATKGLKAMEDLCERYVKLGQDGFMEILNTRLNTIELITDLQRIRDFGIHDFAQWASKYTQELFSKHANAAL